jgi:hypothetical protein
MGAPFLDNFYIFAKSAVSIPVHGIGQSLQTVYKNPLRNPARFMPATVKLSKETQPTSILQHLER